MEQSKKRWTAWFYENWALTTIPLGMLCLVLLPAVYRGFGLVPAIVLLQLPLYLFHQFEEHASGRFGAYVNEMVGHGRTILSYPVMFLVNTLLVWLPILVAFYLSIWTDPALGLAAPYFLALNALLHIGVSIARRESNPGFFNSLVDLPVGAVSIVVITSTTTAGWAYQAIGLVVAVLLHATIGVFVGAEKLAARRGHALS